MTRILMRSAVLLGLGLTLTACAQHNPAEANCFNFGSASICVAHYPENWKIQEG